MKFIMKAATGIALACGLVAAASAPAKAAVHITAGLPWLPPPPVVYPAPYYVPPPPCYAYGPYACARPIYYRPYYWGHRGHWRPRYYW
jgi:hypothetical protein